MARTRSTATFHVVAGATWTVGSLAILAMLGAWHVPFEFPFVPFWILGLVLLAVAVFELAVGLRARRLEAGVTPDAGSRHHRVSAPPGADRVATAAGDVPTADEPGRATTRLSGSVNLVYGVLGLLAGVVFLVLNLGDPAHTDAGDWFWCLVGLVVGAFLLWRGAVAQRR